MAIPNPFKNIWGSTTTAIDNDLLNMKPGSAMGVGPSKYDEYYEMLKEKEEMIRQRQSLTNAHMYGQQMMAKYPAYASTDAPDELYDLAVRAIETAKNRDIDSISAEGEIKRESVPNQIVSLGGIPASTKLDRLKSTLGSSFSERQTKELLAMIDKAIVDVEREATRVRLATFLVGGF